MAGALAFVLALLVLVVTELSFAADERATAQRDFASDARLAVGRLRRVVVGMESAQRGFMLTARPEYRAPYDTMLGQTAQVLESVRQLATRRPAQRDTLEQLAVLSERKFSELAEVMRLLDAGNTKAASNLLLTGIGREQSERIQQLVDAMIAQEEAAYEQAGVLRQTIRNWSRLAVLAMILISLLSLLASLRVDRERESERARFVADLSAERDKLEAEVTRRTAELTDLAHHLQTVREDERGRLARELHDELGGLLTAAKMDLARVRKRLTDSGPELAERIAHLGRTLDSGIALKRNIIENLRPSALQNLGLPRTLEILCGDFAKASEIQVDADIADLKLGGEPALTLYRVTQEALTNIAKYADARRVRVSLEALPGQARVTVEDDGIGFTPGQARVGSHGLAGMRFRAQSCGGTWVLRTAPGQGTTVTVTVPVQDTGAGGSAPA
jgi:signal transduction histidine kinase